MNPYEDDAPTNVQGGDAPASRPANSDQKTAITAAVVGTVALGGAAVAMSQFLNDDDSTVAVTTETDPNGGQTPEPDPNANLDPNANTNQTLVDPNAQTPPLTDPNANQIPPIVVDPTHEQTFEEAFAEARAAQGPGHYFEFHGQTYNTYLNEEWEGMSHHQQQDFLATVPGYEMPGGGGGGGVGGAGNGSGSALAGGEIPPARDEVPPAVDDVAPDITVDDTPETPVVAANHSTPTDNDIIVEVESPNAPDAPSDTASKIDYVDIEIDGNNISVVDFDNDDRPDALLNNDTNVILADTDGDHILDTRAEYNADSGHFENRQQIEETITIDGSMDTLHQQHPDDNTMLADNSDMGPDFDNDAPIDDYDV